MIFTLLLKVEDKTLVLDKYIVYVYACGRLEGCCRCVDSLSLSLSLSLLKIVINHSFLYRIIAQWQSRDIENMLKGYKMDLAALIGTKLPAGLMNFYFKHAVLRKVEQ